MVGIWVSNFIFKNENLKDTWDLSILIALQSKFSKYFQLNMVDQTIFRQ